MPSLPPVPPKLTTPTIVSLPIQPRNPTDITTGRVSMAQQRRIGGVVVAWGKLENAINDLIWTIDGTSMLSGRTETQDLDMTKLLGTLWRSVSTNLPGRSLGNERKAITDIINHINEWKVARNLIVHGTWAEREGTPIVGSLRAETTDPKNVTFEDFEPRRMYAMERLAVDATKNVYAIISRLEALRKKSSPPPQTDFP